MASEARTSTSPTRIDRELLRDWALPVQGDDKESRGRVLLLGGSAHTPGAVLLAGEAALRAGAGKLQIATAVPVAAAVAVAVPEALVLPLPTSKDGSITTRAADQVLDLAADADAVLLGPGFSDVGRSVALLEAVMPRLEAPAVLDALASAFVTEHPGGLRHLSGRCVLTVNPAELARTLGAEPGEVETDPEEATGRLAQEAGVAVLCGGQSKTIASPDRHLWATDVGGPGLGVSGSGDVQAGIVAGLLARGAEPEQAAAWGGFLHGMAGERLAAQAGTLGFLAREIAGCVPALLEELSAPQPGR